MHRIALLLLLCCLGITARAFEFAGYRIQIPAEFNRGPVSAAPAGDFRTWAFMPAQAATGSTLMQMTVWKRAEKDTVTATEAQQRQRSIRYLGVFLAGVRDQMQDFKTAEVEDVTILGEPSVRVHWQGRKSGLPMEGVMYCVLNGGKVLILHAQDFSAYEGRYIASAVAAFKKLAR